MLFRAHPDFDEVAFVFFFDFQLCRKRKLQLGQFQQKAA